jgi:hypothetical protein
MVYRAASNEIDGVDPLSQSVQYEMDAAGVTGWLMAVAGSADGFACWMRCSAGL